MTQNKVLILDPDRESLKLFNLLYKKYYSIYLCQNLEQALSILTKEEIKVIVSEYNINGQTAEDLFSVCIKTKPYIARVLLTSLSSKDKIINIINDSKIFHYALKPIQSDELKGVIDKGINHYDLQDANALLIKNLKQKNRDLKWYLQKLEKEEAKIRQIFNASNDFIIIIDEHGNILESNTKAEKTLSLASQKGTTKKFYTLLSEESKDKFSKYLNLLDKNHQELLQVDLWIVKKRWRTFEINGQLVTFINDRSFLLVLRDITERKEIEKKILQTIINTEEKERRRFAEELHDGIGPLLSTTKLYLQWLIKPNSKAKKETVLAKIESTLEETISSLREVSNTLSPNVLENFGLETALRNFFDRVSGISGININFHSEMLHRLSFELEVTLYRVICECVNNTIKHAKASNINVLFNLKNQCLVINYSDDGIGFNTDIFFSSPKGIGLMNIKNRVHSLGGTISFNSQENKGVEIKIEFKNITAQNEQPKTISSR